MESVALLVQFCNPLIGAAAAEAAVEALSNDYPRHPDLCVAAGHLPLAGSRGEGGWHRGQARGRRETQ